MRFRAKLRIGPLVMLLGIGPALASDWADDKDAAKNPQFGKSQAICRALKSRQGPRERRAGCGAGRQARGLLLGGALLRHRPPRRRGGGTAMRLRREEGGRPAGRRLRLHGRPFLDDDLRQRRRRGPQPRRRDGAGVPGRFRPGRDRRAGAASRQAQGRTLDRHRFQPVRRHHQRHDDGDLRRPRSADRAQQAEAGAGRSDVRLDPGGSRRLGHAPTVRVSLHRCARGERGRSIRHRPRRLRGGGGRQAGASLLRRCWRRSRPGSSLLLPRTTPRRRMRR